MDAPPAPVADGAMIMRDFLIKNPRDGETYNLEALLQANVLLPFGQKLIIVHPNGREEVAYAVGNWHGRSLQDMRPNVFGQNRAVRSVVLDSVYVVHRSKVNGNKRFHEGMKVAFPAEEGFPYGVIVSIADLADNHVMVNMSGDTPDRLRRVAIKDLVPYAESRVRVSNVIAAGIQDEKKAVSIPQGAAIGRGELPIAQMDLV